MCFCLFYSEWCLVLNVFVCVCFACVVTYRPVERDCMFVCMCVLVVFSCVNCLIVSVFVCIMSEKVSLVYIIIYMLFSYQLSHLILYMCVCFICFFFFLIKRCSWSCILILNVWFFFLYFFLLSFNPYP